MPSNHPLWSPSPPPSIIPSIRVFSSEAVLCITWPKYWTFSFSISSSNEYSGLISFRMHWFDLAVQMTLLHLSPTESLLQMSPRVFSNTTVQKHQFFCAQLSLWFSSHIHAWLTGKTIVLTRQTLIRKVAPLLFNMLSMLVIAFLPRSKHL